MSGQPFSQLNPINFLQTFVTQSLELSELCESDKNNKPVNRIEQLGLNAGGFSKRFIVKNEVSSGRSIMPNTAI